MKISILHRTTINMGDHGESRSIARDIKEGETVEQLAGRLLNETGSNPEYFDCIEIRLIKESK